MEITYNALFYKEQDDIYSVVFPDIAFGATQGESLDDAIYMAQDYLKTHFEGCGVGDLPQANSLEHAIEQQSKVNAKDGYDGQLVCVIPITTHVQERCKRVNITLPERILSAVDAVAQNRSAFIHQALQEKLNHLRKHS